MTTCESCGHVVEPGALFCGHCGKPVQTAVTAPLPHLSGAAAHQGATATLASVPSPASDGNAFTWPFQQANWRGRLWILLLGWIPVFGLLSAMTVSIGWMMDAIGRRGRDQVDKLPQPRSLLVMFVHGIVYWVMLSFYVTVPIWLLGTLFAAETAIITQEFHRWVMNSGQNAIITGINIVALGLGASEPITLIPQQDLLSLIRHWALVYTAGFFLPVFWVVFAVPVFMAATIRFAVSGRFGSYFRPIANTGFVLRHFFGFLWLFAVMVALIVMAGLLPLVGIYLLFTVGLWIIAYYGGRLGAKLHPHG